MQAKYPPISVQRGLASVSHGGNDGKTTNVTIADVGSLARAKERLLGVTANFGGFYATLRLTSTTNLEIQTISTTSAGTVYVGWEIEYGDYLGQIQRGQCSYAPASGVGQYAVNVTLSDIGDIAKARAEMMGLRNNWNAGIMAGSRVQLSSATNLEVCFYGGYNNTMTTNWVAHKVR